jgi:nitrite reductase/ring-hydroxylating ferredoxin subunit
LVCDFCKATYNVKTGERIADDGERGLMGNIVKSLFSATEKTPLRTYELGEKNGQVFINLPINQ